MPTIKIIAPTGTSDARQFKTVNVVTQVPATGGEIGTALQATGPSGNVFKTVQVAATGSAGLETVYVAGYTAPG